MGKNKKRVKISKNADGSIMQFSREPPVPPRVKGFASDEERDEARKIAQTFFTLLQERKDKDINEIPANQIGMLRASLRRQFPGETWMNEAP